MKSHDNVTPSAASESPATTCNLPHVPPGAWIFYPDDPPPEPPQDLPETDGVPLESDWHRLAIALLIESVRWTWRDRDDFYVGGNMFVYFSAQQVRNEDYRGPDFFFVKGASPQKMRETWTVWNEGGKYPDFIIELLSKSTRDEDLTTKKDLYQKTFHALEYCCYDPLNKELLAWRGHAQYEPIARNEKDWIWIEQMQLWLGIWHGVYHEVEADWPRFYDAQGNLLLTRAEGEHRIAEAERLRADAATEGAKAERQLAEAEKQRADALAAELAQLKAQIAAKQ